MFWQQICTVCNSSICNTWLRDIGILAAARVCVSVCHRCIQFRQGGTLVLAVKTGEAKIEHASTILNHLQG